jgi:protein-tyrosine phosphatase
MAEVLLREELRRAGLAGRAEVESAGTGDWHIGGPMDRRARAALSERGYDGSAHRARQFRADWFGRYDLIAAMDSCNFADLRAMAPDDEAAARVRLFRGFDPDAAGLDPADLDVPDPYGGSLAQYELVFDLVQAAARGLAGQLAAMLGAEPGR